MCGNNKTLNSQTGMALIEAMIAVAVLAFGLLGLAGLQLAGLKSNQIAYLRSVATLQAYDMADRIRAGMTGSYKPLTSVDSTELAAWNTVNARLLPGGSGTVALAGNRFVITVQWSEKCQGGETGCSSGSRTQGVSTEFVP